MLIDRFRSRLSTWKASLLSIGGRLTLIKSVLGSLGIYYLLIFRAPESVLNDLERIRSNFFWGESKKLLTLLFTKRWRWTVHRSPNDLWVKVVKAFHGHEGGFDNNGCSFKGTWANIVGSSNFLYSKGIILNNSFHFNAGCGTRIRFMERYERRLQDPTLYQTLLSLPSTTWDKIIPHKVNIFMWRLSFDRLPHMLNLFLRGMDIQAISCSSCNANVESANHIFFECIIASDLWKLVYRWCKIPFVQALSFEAFKDWLSSCAAHPKERNTGFPSFLLGIWVSLEFQNIVTFKLSTFKEK
ncbi:RNA-directed DNA polymerase, eukaryota, reverse transcriptase zinc-binding domain protein [Tanacetum coccineum]